jgi:hypothetical protein
MHLQAVCHGENSKREEIAWTVKDEAPKLIQTRWRTLYHETVQQHAQTGITIATACRR